MGRGCCTVYHQPGALEKPQLYTDIVCPHPPPLGTAGQWGETGRQPGSRLGAWGIGPGRREGPHRGCPLRLPCAVRLGSAALPNICLCLPCSPWPRGSQVPVPSAPALQLQRSKDLYICLSVLQIFCLGILPVPVPLPQSGFSGSFLFHLNPFIPDSVKEATSGIWGPSVRQSVPWPAPESRRPQFSGAGGWGGDPPQGLEFELRCPVSCHEG